jgi:outer membrane biogenesis lipoprotein LolB
MKLVLAGLALLVLTACAATPSDPVAATDTATCTREQTTGTKISSVRCRTAEQAEQDRRAAAAAHEDIRRTVPVGGAVGQ